MLFLENEAQLQNDAFHVKTSQSAKNQLDSAKNENWPNFDIHPFCTKAVNYNNDYEGNLI